MNIPIIEDPENVYGFRPGWEMVAEPDCPIIQLWDNYGFFVHISYREWILGVTAHLPEPCPDEVLNTVVGAFMEDYRTMYICNN